MESEVDALSKRGKLKKSFTAGKQKSLKKKSGSPERSRAESENETDAFFLNADAGLPLTPDSKRANPSEWDRSDIEALAVATPAVKLLGHVPPHMTDHEKAKLMAYRARRRLDRRDE